MMRAVRIRLRPTKEQDRMLWKLADNTLKLAKEYFFLRNIGFAHTAIEKMLYERWKGLLTTTIANYTIRQLNGQWRAAQASNTKIRVITTPLIYIRCDKIREIDYENRKIKICGLPNGCEIFRYSGVIHWRGKIAGSQIIYIDGDWFLILNIKPKERLRKGNWISIPLENKGNKIAGIDIGIVNLFAVYINDGTTILVKSGKLRSLIHYFRVKIKNYARNGDWHGFRKKYRRYVNRRNYLIRKAIRSLLDLLYSLGVNIIIVGKPSTLPKTKIKKINFEILNNWPYSRIIEWISNVAEEYGIKVIKINEGKTSRLCPLCDIEHGNARKYRGLFICPIHKKAFNADLVAAYNILKRYARAREGRANGVGPAPSPAPPPNVSSLATPHIIIKVREDAPPEIIYSRPRARP